ncbi:MAG: hypothetical protein BWZ10_00044 [candidate division BRC1 bacterium ADurb.BinA364]|nr:MAG: hypothetical protein BWZ10_00044 [candidate division BRC1 bacterium ADurb.BinA364]
MPGTWRPNSTKPGAIRKPPPGWPRRLTNWPADKPGAPPRAKYWIGPKEGRSPTPFSLRAPRRAIWARTPQPRRIAPRARSKRSPKPSKSAPNLRRFRPRLSFAPCSTGCFGRCSACLLRSVRSAGRSAAKARSRRFAWPPAWPRAEWPRSSFKPSAPFPNPKRAPISSRSPAPTKRRRRWPRPRARG